MAAPRWYEPPAHVRVCRSRPNPMNVLHPVMSRLPVLASGGGVAIDADYTVLYQMALFVVLMLVLQPLLFDPVLRIFALREQRTEGEKARARELDERAGEILERYQRELERVHQVAAEEREHLRSETAKLEAEILGEARAATARIVDEGRQKIASEMQAIQFDLGKESERLSRQIAERVLGREVN
jgi:F-type H+-transporting ATPase subunit b